ncbi:MAG: RNA methyltransferase substrate-binding domain-containing protein, partial [Terriglobales bacterium]
MIYGIHTVGEAVQSRGRALEYVAFSAGRSDARVQRLVEACRAAGVAVRFLPRRQLDRLAGTPA